MNELWDGVFCLQFHWRTQTKIESQVFVCFYVRRNTAAALPSYYCSKHNAEYWVDDFVNVEYIYNVEVQLLIGLKNNFSRSFGKKPIIMGNLGICCNNLT